MLTTLLHYILSNPTTILSQYNEHSHDFAVVHVVGDSQNVADPYQSFPAKHITIFIILLSSFPSMKEHKDNVTQRV